MDKPIHRVETTVSENGTIVIDNVPFQPGEEVEITIFSHAASERKRYPLRGTVIKYEDPFGSVAEDDWEVLQ